MDWIILEWLKDGKVYKANDVVLSARIQRRYVKKYEMNKEKIKK